MDSFKDVLEAAQAYCKTQMAPFVIYSFVDYDSFEVVAAEW